MCESARCMRYTCNVCAMFLYTTRLIRGVHARFLLLRIGRDARRGVLLLSYIGRAARPRPLPPSGTPLPSLAVVPYTWHQTPKSFAMSQNPTESGTVRRTSSRIQQLPSINYFPDDIPDIYDVSDSQQKTPGRSGEVDIDKRLSLVKRALQENGFHSLLDAAFTEVLHRFDDVRTDAGTFVSSGCLRSLIKILQDSGLLMPAERHAICAILQGPDIYRDQFETVCDAPALNQSLSNNDFNPHAILSFSFDSIYSQLRDIGPNLLDLFHILLEPSGAIPEPSLNTKRQIVTGLAAMAYNRSQRTNYVASIFAIYLYASGTPKRVMEALNHLKLCVSRRTLGRILEQMADRARKRLHGLGPSPRPAIFVFDNLTVPATVRYTRLDNSSEFLAYTAGYVLVPPTSHDPPQRFLQGVDVRVDRVRDLTVTDFLPSAGDISNIDRCFRAVVLENISWCVRNVSVKFPKVEGMRMPLIDPIDRSKVPDIHPLPTYDLNEGEISGVIEILNCIKTDFSLSETQCQTQLFLFCGDLMTIRNIRYF